MYAEAREICQSLAGREASKELWEVLYLLGGLKSAAQRTAAPVWELRTKKLHKEMLQWQIRRHINKGECPALSIGSRSSLGEQPLSLSTEDKRVKNNRSGSITKFARYRLLVGN